MMEMEICYPIPFLMESKITPTIMQVAPSRGIHCIYGRMLFLTFTMALQTVLMQMDLQTLRFRHRFEKHK